MYSFDNLKTPKSIGSGLADSLLLAPMDFFQTIATVPAGIGSGGAEVTITDDHIFKSSKGFLQINLGPFKNDFSAKGINDIPGAAFDQVIKIFIPGSYAVLHETIKNLLNQPLIVLARDANCADNLYYQLGSSCRAAYLSADFSTGTIRDGVKGYEVQIFWLNSFIQIYEGLITKYIESAPGNSSVFLANVNTHDIAGTVEEMAVFYGAASSTNITQIYQMIAASVDVPIIQVSLANDQGEEIQDCLVPVDLSTEENFIASLYNWIAANGTDQYLQVYGTSLRLVDPDATESYFGIAIPIDILGYEADGETFILSSDDFILKS